MAKVYDHAVIYNGVLVPANTPIEEKAGTTKAPKTANEKGGAKQNDKTAD